jgi:hypothetical protein
MTVMLKLPVLFEVLKGDVVVPEITPVSGFSDKPAGSVPAEIDQAPVAGISKVPVTAVLANEYGTLW